jgi:hypothetical protein
MSTPWDDRKLHAWSQFLLTVTVRYVDGCACTSCDEVRTRFVRRWQHYAPRPVATPLTPRRP